jgi:hypothetical protein
MSGDREVWLGRVVAKCEAWGSLLMKMWLSWALWEVQRSSVHIRDWMAVGKGILVRLLCVGTVESVVLERLRQKEMLPMMAKLQVPLSMQNLCRCRRFLHCPAYWHSRHWFRMGSNENDKAQKVGL